MRATFYGITADGGNGQVAYSWDASTAVAASVRRLWFTDGNDRIEASTHLVARLVERPDLTVDVRPELWWGTNTRPDAPYFNPKQSVSADAGVAARHLLWRRYERSLYQEFRLSAGVFAQQAYPTHWTGSVGYEQALRLTTESTLYYGVGWARRVYRRRPGRRPPFLRQPRSPVRLMRLPLPALAASCLALAVVCTPGIRADERDPLRFLSVVMHDVVDERAALDADSITTSDLVAFFEYLVSNHWHALTLDEIERARRGDAVLPDRSILITADDAYASDYTRLYPLLLAYRMHALLAVEGEWIEAGVGPGGSKHITWNQAREMQASGLVEFISHAYALAHGDQGQPAGQHAPGLRVPVVRSGARIRAGRRLPRAHHRGPAALERPLMTRELGRAPRAIAWPYGRYTRLSTEAAAAVGFRFWPDVRPGAGRCAPPDDDSALLALQRFTAAGHRREPARERHAAADTAARRAARVEPVPGGPGARRSACSARPSSACGRWGRLRS